MASDPHKVGHCFCVKTDMRFLGALPGKHGNVNVSEVLTHTLDFLEGTANSEMCEHDHDVLCMMQSNSPQMSAALQPFNMKVMPRSKSLCITSELRSKSIKANSDYNACPVNVVSRADPAFYRTLIMLGKDTVFSVEKQGERNAVGMPHGQNIVPTAPCAHGAVRMLAMHTPIRERERLAIEGLVKANVHMIPKWTHCNALPIRCAGLTGKRTTDTAYIKHGPWELNPTDMKQATRQRAHIAKHLNAIGFEPVGFHCTRLYFEAEAAPAQE